MPLSIDLPPDVLAALKGRAAARGRTAEEEAAVAVAEALDVFFNPPPPAPSPLSPEEEARFHAEALARIEEHRRLHPPDWSRVERAEQSLAEVLREREKEGAAAGISRQEWRHYWKTLELDGDAADAEEERVEAKLNGWDDGADAARDAA